MYFTEENSDQFRPEILYILYCRWAKQSATRKLSATDKTSDPTANSSLSQTARTSLASSASKCPDKSARTPAARAATVICAPSLPAREDSSHSPVRPQPVPTSSPPSPPPAPPVCRAKTASDRHLKDYTSLAKIPFCLLEMLPQLSTNQLHLLRSITANTTVL